HSLNIIYLMTLSPRQPTHTLFPYTTLFRSLFVDDFIDHRGDALARERVFAGHHFVEHDAQRKDVAPAIDRAALHLFRRHVARRADRKSTRLNSSHRTRSYAVFCLKTKN